MDNNLRAKELIEVVNTTPMALEEQKQVKTGVMGLNLRKNY